MARGSLKALLWWPRPTDSGELEFPNPQLLQRFLRVERVTGIEPALSAWELLERMGMCLVPCVFRGHERPEVSLGCPPQWHANGTLKIGCSAPGSLLAKSRPSRHLPSQSTYAAHLVGIMRG